MAFDDLQFPVPTPDPNSGQELRTTFVDVVGGSATYAALTASCFSEVRVVAVVGEDFPAAMLDTLQQRGVDTSGIERAEGKTFRWSGRYHEDLVGRDTLDTQLNVFADFRPKLPEGYRKSPIVLLGNIHPALQLEVLDQVEKPELVVADTMNFWISGEAELLNKVLERVDLLVINDEEARLLTGRHNISQAAAAILERGPRGLIIKRGEHGSLYFDRDDVFAASAFPLATVHDPTGAGDTYAGGLLGYLATQPNFDHACMRRAIVHGTATASFCVQAVGPAALLELERDAVHARAKEIMRLYHVSEN